VLTAAATKLDATIVSVDRNVEPPSILVKFTDGHTRARGAIRSFCTAIFCPCGGSPYKREWGEISQAQWQYGPLVGDTTFARLTPGPHTRLTAHGDMRTESEKQADEKTDEERLADPERP
jgi:hypothetical protein